MKLKVKYSTLLLLLAWSYSYGQIEQYNYKRELKGITDNWHKVVLPDEIFGKVSSNLYDIRIFGITANNDTNEAPYLLHLTTEKVSSNDVGFKTLNVSHNEKGYYFTFEIPTNEPINQIKLDFKRKNFDWKLKLEGSQNQQEWFTVIEDYRILSIKNKLTDFQFTNIRFPNSRYRFFRLFVASKENPYLMVAEVSQYERIDGDYRIYPITKNKIIEDKQTKQTEIEIDLQLPVPVSHIKIGIKNTFDYYRPVTIKFLADSFKTEQGWKYRFNTLTSGTLNSLEVNEFKFRSTILQKLKILIHNLDNQHLTIDTIEVKGYLHELVGRFTEEATYYLTYGNSKAGKPQYDIDRFSDKIPKTMTTLILGNEQAIDKEEISVTEPLFKNKTWLWIIITAIILLLGWFSIKMIRKN
jgi:hypothetical protein